MPLSDHEQRLLEQMERALYAEDPKFATSLRSSGDRSAGRRRSAFGVGLALIGAGALLGGVAWSMVAVGVAGFLVMLVGSYLVVSAIGRRSTAAPAAPPQRSQRAPRSAGFMDRMEDRWRRRRDGDQEL